MEICIMALCISKRQMTEEECEDICQRQEDGLTVSVEVHHRLLPNARRNFVFEDLIDEAHPFSLFGQAAQTLGHEDMLWHIYRHAFAKPLIEQSIRLIWVADFVSLVEKYLDDIDWDKVKATYPQVCNVLPAFHTLTPWSEKVLDRLDIPIDPPLKGSGQSFQGWPRSSLAEQRRKGIGRFLVDTFWPPEWWLQLYYGVGRGSPGWWWTRFVGHPLHIASWVLQYLRERK